MSSLLKFTFNAEGKRINGYLKTSPSSDFQDVKRKINTSLFEEHQQPSCEIRFYWIGEYHTLPSLTQKKNMFICTLPLKWRCSSGKGFFLYTMKIRKVFIVYFTIIMCAACVCIWFCSVWVVYAINNNNTKMHFGLCKF